jgi:type IV pilus modification protein PilV
MRRRAVAGYTMLEIMISVVVMTIGATGILAMQGASVRSNQDASETSIAVNFATTWMERVKRDARLWTAQTNASLVANTKYLSMYAATPNAWAVPPTTAPESAGADYFGFDTPIATGDVRYCVNLRFNIAHAIGGQVDAMRADVMVWWHRNAQDTTRNTQACATALTDTQASSASAADRQLRKHFLSTVVTWRDPAVWP